MVDIVAKDGGDSHGQQREHGEDGFSGTAHIAHVAIDNQCNNSSGHQTNLDTFLLGEVARERAGGYSKHDDILNNCHFVATPEGVRVSSIERQVALQHVDGIFLEGEDGAIVEHAQQGNEPETKAGENLANIFHLEGVVFLLSLTGLAVELLVHEEVGDEHDEGDAEQHDSELNSVVDMHLAAQLGEVGRENHAGGYTQTGKSHLGTHSQSGFTTLEPFDDTAAHRDTSHLAAATEKHEAAGSQLGRSRHATIERSNADFIEQGNVV